PTLLKPKKKLRASTARRSINVPDEMDYEEMSEPNMKLSRALLIVLVLHVVAVAGIIAFNTIKSRQGSFPSKAPSAVSASADSVVTTSTVENMSADQTAQVEQAKPALPVTKSDRDSEPAKALPVSSIQSDAKTYVVVKGDNPVSIARKHKVSESELLKVNNIDDPRKLQIGQKLIIPAPTKKSKK
ncbi:MAG: LysM peptidoglycan-binding domain-containing protein, partial [Chthoniobacterales bacterium]